MPQLLLLGLRILLVEDDPIIALDIAETLMQAGATVIGQAHRVESALRLIEGEALDVAVLDYRLEAETSLPVAARLAEMKVPLLFYARRAGNGCTATSPFWNKSTRPERLLAAIRALMEHR
jgi:DNA-binding response OmpR family regulator